MRKGEATRRTILDHATGLATQIGLEGLSIGRLALDLGLSKSGLFAHFQSKESLQLQVLEHAAARFVDVVVRPSLKAPRGEPRVRSLFENWLTWPERSQFAAGCLFVAAAVELDDQAGPCRDRLVQLQRDWLDTMAGAVRIAIGEGHFREGLDPDQFAHDLYSVMLGCHHATRLMKDPRAEERTRNAFEGLVAAARGPRKSGAVRARPRRT